MSLAKNSNASAVSLEPCLRWPERFRVVLAHFTDYMIESFWALLENFGLVFKESPFCISKVLVLDIFLQIDMRLTAWLDALCYLLALVSSFADKNRSWFFAQRYQLISTTTTITRDTLFYGENLFNITKMFSHYFQDTRESVTGFCFATFLRIASFMDVSQIAQVRYF